MMKCVKIVCDFSIGGPIWQSNQNLASAAGNLILTMLAAVAAFSIWRAEIASIRKAAKTEDRHCYARPMPGDDFPAFRTRLLVGAKARLAGMESLIQ
jgi:hypothetical protein